jgi:hypothetical protein
MNVNWEGDCGSSLLFSLVFPYIKPDLTGIPFSSGHFCPVIGPLKSVAISVAASVLGHKQRAQHLSNIRDIMPSSPKSVGWW